jgi:hypothetical protein
VSKNGRPVRRTDDIPSSKEEIMAFETASRPAARTGAVAASARPWLRAGMLAGPLFLLVSFAQMPGRAGFDPTKHAFSFLLLGPGGWIQALNFVAGGLLLVAGGVGLRRVCGRVAGALACAVGLGMIAGGLFPPDPYRGYPPGSAEGPMSTSGLLHAVAFTTAMVSWAALLAVLGRWFAGRGRRLPAVAAAVTVAGLVAVPVTTGQPFDVILLYVAASAAYVVTAVLFGLVGSTARTAAEPEEAR